MSMIYLTLGWTAGILVAWQWGNDVPLRTVAIVAGLVAIWLWVLDSGGHKMRPVVLGVVILAAMGILRMEAARPSADADHVSRLNGRDAVSLTGVVRDVPQTSDFGISVQFDVEEAESLNVVRRMHGRVLLQLPRQTAVGYGDRLRVTGSLYEPPRLDTFSYADYLARQNVFSILRADHVRIVEHNQGSSLRQRLFSIHEDARQIITDALPEPQAGLLTGILLGDESRLAPDVADAFNATGTSHIIAISGFNMTLIAGIILAVSRTILQRRVLAIGLSMIVLAIYTIFVGGSAGVVRAAVMSGVLISAPLVQRRTYIPASLSFTAFVMTVMDPLVLWDIGFQLSFASVLGMAILVPPLDRWFRRVMHARLGEALGGEIARWLSEPVIVTLAAQVVTLPIILHYFGRLSVLSPIANFLIIPVQPLILMLGGAATLISFAIPAVGQMLFWATWVFLAFTTAIVREFATLDAGVNAHLSAEALWLLVIGSILLVILNATRPTWYERGWHAFMNRKPLEKLALTLRYAPLVMALVVVGGIGQRIVNQPDDRLHIIFLDMGHSHSILMRTPEGAVFLVDGGRFPSRLLTALGDYLPPQTDQIDMLWLSSDEEIDIAGLTEVINRYKIQTVMSAPQPPLEASYVNLLQDLEAQNIPILPVEAGRRTRTADGVEITVLAPNEDVTHLVLRVEFGQAVFLITTDLSSREEMALLSDPHQVQATVLQAGRHASRGSNDPDWIAAVDPQIVVVQTDPNAFSDETDESIVGSFDGRRLYRTDQQGAVEIRTDGETLEIITER